MKNFYSRSCYALFALITPQLTLANTVYIAVDNYDYVSVLDEIDLDYTAMGLAVGGSIAFGDRSTLQLELGQWSDDSGLADAGSSRFESRLASIGWSYAMGDWQIYASYADITDEIELMHGRSNEFFSFSDINSSTLSLTASYERAVGAWANYFSFGVQRNDSKLVSMLDQANQRIVQEDDSLYAMAKVGTDYYLPGGDKSAWYFGGSLAWYQELSSDQSISETQMGGMPGQGTPPPARAGGNSANNGNAGNGGNNINRTFGGDFGLLGLFVTYEINTRWSLDWKSSIGFAGDQNANSHALTLSYQF